MRPHRILVVDDEPNIRRIVTTYLRREGFDVVEASDGDAALSMFDRWSPDLVLLDVMMPGRDGIEVLRDLRHRSEVYVIMLTARAEETELVVGLTVGADDYVTKPFSTKELVARVKAVLRRERAEGPPSSPAGLLDTGVLSLDVERHEATVDGDMVTLTAQEFELFSTMAASPGRVFSRRQLLEQVWGWDHIGDERVVDVHIRKLRRALGDDAADPRIIATVRGVGYKVLGPRCDATASHSDSWWPIWWWSPSEPSPSSPPPVFSGPSCSTPRSNGSASATGGARAVGPEEGEVKGSRSHRHPSRATGRRR